MPEMIDEPIVPDHLTAACWRINRANAALGGPINNCVCASLALVALLREQGQAAQVVQVTVRLAADGRPGADYILGGDDGKPAPAGGWYGHLVAVSGGHLLDPTVDQVDVDCDGQKILLPTLVLPLPDTWPSGSAGTTIGAVSVTYRRHRRQFGWQKSPSARPSAYMPIVQKAKQTSP